MVNFILISIGNCFISFSNFIESNLVSNFLATILGGICLYFFLDRRIRATLTKSEKIRLTDNFRDELVHNLVISQRVTEFGTENEGNISRTIISRYETKCAYDFLTSREFADYKARSLIRGLLNSIKNSELLYDLIYIGQSSVASKENAQNYINSATSITNKIVLLLEKLNQLKSTL